MPLDLSYFTLEYDGEEKTFPEWGFTDPLQSIGSGCAGTFKVRVPGVADLLADPPIPFLGQVIIRRYVDAGDGPVAEIIFQGRQYLDRIEADRNPAHVLVFMDAWRDLERTVFQQYWKMIKNGDPPANTYFSRVSLFQSFGIPWSYQSTGAQITEIIDYAVTCGVNLQVGTIDPALFRPTFPMRSVMCAAALNVCTELDPGTTFEIDYSTIPPTFNAWLRDTAEAVTLPWSGGTRHQSAKIVPRYDLQAGVGIPQVVIQYQLNNQVDGVTSTFPIMDGWPANSTGQAIGAVVAAIDLRGVNRTDVFVQSAVLLPNVVEYWLVKKPELANEKNYQDVELIPGIVQVNGQDWPGDIVLPDGSHVTMDDLPNELINGEVQSWMSTAGTPVVAATVSLSVKVKYTQIDANGQPVYKTNDDEGHVISTRVKITNSPAGTAAYTQYFDAGETPIGTPNTTTGLAHQYYAALALLQWEGTFVLSEKNSLGQPEVQQVITPRHAVNISGGRPEWLTMNACVQKVNIDWMRGRTEIQLGPPKQLSLQDASQRMQSLRFRRILDNQNLRGSGQAAAAGNTVGGDTAQENTTEAMPNLNEDVMVALAESSGGGIDTSGGSGGSGS